jgi:hypothetical protein
MTSALTFSQLRSGTLTASLESSQMPRSSTMLISTTIHTHAQWKETELFSTTAPLVLSLDQELKPFVIVLRPPNTKPHDPILIIII